MADTLQAPALPDAQTAYNNLFDGVRARVFFGKMASAGRQPRSEAEALSMLKLAGKLRTVKDQQHKVAGAGDDPYGRACEALDSILAQNGLDAGVKQAAAQETQAAIADVARAFAGDVTLYNSALALKAAEAESIREQYDAMKQAQGNAA